MEDFNPFLDALVAPDFTKAEHFDIPIDEMVDKYGNMFQSRHKQIWKNAWQHNMLQLKQAMGKENTQFFRNTIELEFMRMYRSMVLLEPRNGKAIRFVYAGPNDNECRPFCATRVGNAYTPTQIYSWNRFDWDGKITEKYGATYEDIYTNLGGFGCRHFLMPD